jgi:hypothetical protein
MSANVAALPPICTATPAFWGRTDQKYIFAKSKIVAIYIKKKTMSNAAIIEFPNK